MGHVEGVCIPLLLRKLVVGRISWATSHMKNLSFGVSCSFQILPQSFSSFEIGDLVSSSIALYALLRVNNPECPSHPKNLSWIAGGVFGDKINFDFHPDSSMKLSRMVFMIVTPLPISS